MKFFTVHDFMVKELSLSGNELMIYALIYSFCQNYGTFFGSRRYIGESVGASISSINRSLKRLLEKGYIASMPMKSNNGSVCYICTDAKRTTQSKPRAPNGNTSCTEPRNLADILLDQLSFDPVAVKISVAEEQARYDAEEDRYELLEQLLPEKLYNKCTILEGECVPPESFGDLVKERTDSGVSNRNRGCSESEHNNKDYNNQLSSHSLSCAREKPKRLYDPKHHFRRYGSAGNVIMTELQYKHLLTLVDGKCLSDYIERLDDYYSENVEAVPRSCYKILLRWIKEDSALIIESE